MRVVGKDKGKLKQSGKLAGEQKGGDAKSELKLSVGLPDEILDEVFDPLTAKQRRHNRKDTEAKITKREPLLVDKFLQHQFSSHENRLFDVQQLKRLAQNANRFVLTEEGTRRYAEVMRDIPDMIAVHQEFALQPYETMWVECDARVVFETTSKKPSDELADLRIGYLFHNNTVYSVSDSNEELGVGLMPIKYHLHRPWKLEEQIKFAEQAGISRLGLVGWFWGSVMRHWLVNAELANTALEKLRQGGSITIPKGSPVEVFDKVWQEIGLEKKKEYGPETLAYGPNDEQNLTLAKTLRNSHTASWLNEEWILRSPVHSRKALIDGSAGDLRNIVTILLLMNQPSVISYVQEVGFGKGFSKGKLRNYVSHNVVTINVDPKPIIQRLSIGTGSPHRHHLVRGHFCQNADARNGSRRGCEHQWEQDDDKHWHCVTCEGKRWWRKDHSRGDSFIGVVDKQYAIVE